jgi:hypothetical protein
MWWCDGVGSLGESDYERWFATIPTMLQSHIDPNRRGHGGRPGGAGVVRGAGVLQSRGSALQYAWIDIVARALPLADDDRR